MLNKDFKKKRTSARLLKISFRKKRRHFVFSVLNLHTKLKAVKVK